MMVNSNDLIINVGRNSNDTAALIWSAADDLVGAAFFDCLKIDA